MIDKNGGEPASTKLIEVLVAFRELGVKSNRKIIADDYTQELRLAA